MTKNPILNALAALSYIALIVSIIFYAPAYIHVEENNILIPIGMLSLFVFSAASMGYIFMYQPLRLFLEGEKQGAVHLFLKTLVAFALCAAAFVSVGLYLLSHS
jgi:hypothetical protein